MREAGVRTKGWQGGGPVVSTGGELSFTGQEKEFDHGSKEKVYCNG